MNLTFEQAANEQEFQEAKQSALVLVSDKFNVSNITLDCDNLEDIEEQIKTLNDYADKCWLLSSILLYSLVYNKKLFSQSNMTWQEYVFKAKRRLNMDRAEIYESLASARFFVKHHKQLIEQGWTPAGSHRKLSRAECAFELTGDIDSVISHLVNDSYLKFKAWYSSFKPVQSLPMPTNKARNDIDIIDNNITINGIKAINFSDHVQDKDKQRFENYIVQIFEAIKYGYEPAIIPVKNQKEVSELHKYYNKNKEN